MAKQLALDLPVRGGKRRGAGRPRLHQKPGLLGKEVPHRKRAHFASCKAVHVTQRVGPGVGHLRKQSIANVFLRAFKDASKRDWVRIVHYSIQSNHLHLIVEAEDAAGLSKGMKGLAVRIARRLNAHLRRRGPVFVDHYHAHLLGSRREVANAVRYVVANHARHSREPLARRFHDPLATSPDAPLTAPRLWLLRIGWRLEPSGRMIPRTSRHDISG